MEERHNFMNVIERFVSETISGPLGIDIREAAAIFENYSIGFHGFNQDDMRYQERDLSVIAWSLSQALGIYAPGLPSLLSYPDFPLADDRRTLMDSVGSILRRVNGPQPISFNDDFYKTGELIMPCPIEYLEMVLDFLAKIEDQYTRLCRETGVDVAHTYSFMQYFDWDWRHYQESNTDMVKENLPHIGNSRSILFAKTVGRCLDFVKRHLPTESWVHWLDHPTGYSDNYDPSKICEELLSKGIGSFIPVPVLTDLSDANPPIPMEFADARTIRVTRLVEVVALRVPEIREIFGMIDGPISMSKFERILWEYLRHGEGIVEHLAYYLTRYLGIRILQLAMMRERYFSSLSLEQFEGFRRIISCMARLEPLVDAVVGPLARC